MSKGDKENKQRQNIGTKITEPSNIQDKNKKNKKSK